MKIISVINYKGGVGKTTLTANLAAELAYRDYKVLMIDLDPQASLTFSFMDPNTWKKEYSIDKTVKNWFKPSKDVKPFCELIIEPKAVSKRLGELDKKKGSLHLISSHLDLINVDLELATQLGGANLQQAKHNFIKVHKRLVDGINEIDNGEYDLILIDCPPNFNIVTKNAIVASDHILIPAKPDYLSTLGIDYLKMSLDRLIKEYNEYCEIEEEDDEVDKINPEITGVVFTMVQIRNGQPISALRPYINQTKKLGIPVFTDFIRENKTIFAGAASYGVPAILDSSYKPDDIEGMEKIVDEFIKKVGL